MGKIKEQRKPKGKGRFEYINEKVKNQIGKKVARRRKDKISLELNNQMIVVRKRMLVHFHTSCVTPLSLRGPEEGPEFLPRDTRTRHIPNCEMVWHSCNLCRASHLLRNVSGLLTAPYQHNCCVRRECFPRVDL